MNAPRLTLLALSLLLLGAATGVRAMGAFTEATSASAPCAASPGDTVNATCPITGRAVDGTTTVEHAGKRIGVCCAKCQAAVGAWSAEQKDAYLAKLAGTQAAPTNEPAAPPAFEEPYLLATCPISGELLGASPTAVTIGGRTVQVCCAKCKAVAEADPAGTLTKVDALHAAQQRALYPLTTCVVMPEETLLGQEGADVAKEVVVGNRLFRVCCPGCIRKVKKDPAKFAAVLDAAALEAQRATYPLAHCIVEPTAKFGAENPPHEFVLAGRLVRTCCKGCEAKVRAEPLKYVGALDAARAAAQQGSQQGAQPAGATK